MKRSHSLAHGEQSKLRSMLQQLPVTRARSWMLVGTVVQRLRATWCADTSEGSRSRHRDTRSARTNPIFASRCGAPVAEWRMLRYLTHSHTSQLHQATSRRLQHTQLCKHCNLKLE